MSHQRLSHLTCRAVRHQTSSVAESVRQTCRRPVCLSSNISRTQSASYSSFIRQRQTIPSYSSANILISSRCSRHPRPLIQNSSTFSTAQAPQAPAIATLNPRNDDDGNAMFIEISPRAAKVCGDDKCVLSLQSCFWYWACKMHLAVLELAWVSTSESTLL